MEKKKVLPRFIRWMLLILMHAMAVVAVICVCTLIKNTEVRNQRYNGSEYYRLDPLIEMGTFEHSETFQSIMERDLNDLAVMTVIRKQMEGNDGVYDGDKPVDVPAYVNRKDPSYAGGVSAVYRLEDLLKWYKYGITYKIGTFYSLDSLAYYFGARGISGVPSLDETVSIVNDYNYAEDRTEIAAYSDLNDFISVLESYGISCGGYYEEDSGVTVYSVYMLEDRFMNVEGKSLEEQAGSWEEYGLLCNSLIQAVDELGYNYSMYEDVKAYFERESTNIRYYIQITDEAGTMAFTNENTEPEDRDAYYAGLGSYIIYHPQNMTYETNTEMSQKQLWSIFAPYEYTMNDSVKVWFGIDQEYPVNDVYRQAASAFTGVKNIWVYIGIGVVALLIWLFLLIFLSVMAGRGTGADGSMTLELYWFDYVPAEAALVLAAGISAAYIVYGWLFLQQISREQILGSGNLFINTAAFCILLFSVIFSLFWFSLIRRIKKRTLITDSFCYRIGKWVFKRLKKLCTKMKSATTVFYYNRGTVFRTLLPLFFFIPLNMLLGFGIVMTTVYSYDLQYLLIGILCCMPLVLIDGAGAFLLCKNNIFRKRVVDGIDRISKGDMDYQVDTTGLHGENLNLAKAVNSIGAGIKTAVETSMKDERMKADLITNVSHDIKTPLTSIINYVDLLKREHIETEPVKGYIEVLDTKSQRLKQLTDDLVEASKISSGNIVLHMETINLTELMKQAVGEFSERLLEKDISIMENYGEEPNIITADSRRMWRIIENLFNNIFKYALPATRVYIDIQKTVYQDKPGIQLSIKNISAQSLNISPEELTERFIRGDESRTTEGSGLGLSIARSLTEIQHGQFHIVLDGDLFKVVLLFLEEVPES